MPEGGADVRVEVLLWAACPFARPFAARLLATAGGFRDHGVGAAAARDVGAPRAGNSSSEVVSKAGLVGAGAGAASGFFPAALSERDAGSRFAACVVDGMPEGGGC